MDSTPIPAMVSRAASAMAGYSRPWFLCGGWASDAWLGRVSREHADIDIAVFHDEQDALYRFFADRIPIGHDDNVDGDTQEPWGGRWLDMPAHIHVREPDIEWDFQLCERAGDDLVLLRKPRHTFPLERATAMTAWGVPALTPPIILYHKAITPTWRALPRDPPRAHDVADFEALVPAIDSGDRAWLAAVIESVEPGHPWPAVLRAIG
jgi:hypothetical protein